MNFVLNFLISMYLFTIDLKLYRLLYSDVGGKRRNRRLDMDIFSTFFGLKIVAIESGTKDVL